MKNILENLQDVFSSAFSDAYMKVMEILPDAAIAVLIVGVGLMVASALYYLTIKLLNFFAVDKLAGKTPLERMMRSVGVKKSISEIFALLVFWLAILVTLVSASERLDLQQVSHALAVVTRFIPQLIGALLIAVIGMLIARFLQVLVEQTLSRAQIKYAKGMGKAAYIIILILVIHLALKLLGLDLSIVTTNFIIVVCALMVIFGVGVVFASRTLLENAMACYQLRQMVKVGQTVTIEKVTGRIKNFSLTSVTLETDDGEAVFPALTFFTNSYSLTSDGRD
jgi:small-conductance mechanosensitive channel